MKLRSVGFLRTEDGVSFMEQLYIWFNLLIKRSLFLLTRYPCFNYERIKSQLKSQVSSPHEAHEYLVASTKQINVTFVLIMTYICYAALNLTLPITQFLAFNHNDPESSVRELSDCATDSGSQYHQFTCLVTNCTQLMKNISLGESFSKLPTFSLCHPIISSSFTPVKHLDAPGLLISSISSFGVFLLGSLFPLVQTFFPVSDNLIMFVVAPRLTTDLVQQRAKLILSEMSSSYTNFYPFIEEIQQLRHASHRVSLKYHKTLVRPEVYTRSLMRRMQNFVQDCVPIVRTRWWRFKLAKSISMLFVIIFPMSCAFGFWFFYFIYQNILFKEQLFREMAKEMADSQCAMWSIEDYEISNRSCPLLSPNMELVQLDKLDLRWSWILLIQTAVVHTTPTLGFAMLLACYLATNCELTCWLTELKQQLELASDMSKLHRLIVAHDNTRDVHVDSAACQRFHLASIREQFIENTEIELMMLTSKPLGWNMKPPEVKLNPMFIRQQFAINLITVGQLDFDSYVEFIEKLYVNFRLFVEQVRVYARSITFVIAISHFLNYGLVIIAVYLSRNIRNYRFQPLVVVSFGWISTNTVVFVASKFHANSKRLQWLIWKMIACIPCHRDTRLVHLRSLWLRQVKTLDAEDGLALRVFNVRITYVNILQMAVWTLTLLVFAM